MQRFLVVCGSAAAVYLGLSSVTQAFADSMPIDEFHQVGEGIYRGARPERVGMEALARSGIRVDLNLENDDSEIAKEQRVANELGIRMISIPFSGFWAPDDAKVDGVLSILGDPANYPIYVHCQFGQDRTGLIVGLFRVLHDHWEPRDAYNEMLQVGFHRSLVFLNHYFEERTGFED